jgi:hypothetical protein
MNMQFLNPRRNNMNNQVVNNAHVLPNPLLPFSRKQSNQYSTSSIQPQAVIVNTVNTVSKNDPKKNDPNKIKWGPPTWYLFHTLAHKIRDDQILFLNELFQKIVLICSNLPCPTCTTHATKYMKRINPNTIKTKDDLKNLLFQFHNEVNIRTGVPQFPYDELNDKYENAVTNNVIRNFFIHFKNNSFNVSAIANSMHRDRITAGLVHWLNTNIRNFNP